MLPKMHLCGVGWASLARNAAVSADEELLCQMAAMAAMGPDGGALEDPSKAKLAPAQHKIG